MKEEFTTTELSLAAALSYRGHPIIKMDRVDVRRVTFTFEWEESIEEYVRDFWSHKKLVDPLSYFNELKNLKSQVYEKLGRS